MVRQRLHLAIVGCGQIVTHHLKAMAEKVGSEKLLVRALVDPSAASRHRTQALAQELSLLHENVCKFDSLDDFLHDESTNADCPVVFIAIPHDLHETLTKQAMDAGKIVVLEKPLAPTIQSCQALIRESGNSSNKSSSMLIVAEQSPYWEEVSLAKKCIAENKIGTVITVSSYYYESMRDNVTSGSVDSEGGLGWRGSLKRAGGGIVIDGGLHWIRPLRELVGPITKVIGVTQGGWQPQLQMEGESLAHALFQIRPATSSCAGTQQQPNVVATYSANMLATAPMAHDVCPYFRITGTGGELVIYGDGLFSNGGGGLRLYNDEFPKGHDLISKKDRQGGFFLGFGYLWMEIYRMINERDVEAAHQTVMDAAADVGVALALYDSSSSGQWERTAFTE